MEKLLNTVRFGGEASVLSIREQTEKDQDQILSPYATRATQSKGRKRPEEPCPIRTCFARDRDRILHSNSFRRLKHKTQVFISPSGDHFRQRMTHTLEVVQIARTIARALRLNEDLTEAIALGHDLGHTPFGHTGERVLGRLSSIGFEHNQQSLRVVEVLERDGKGLNLTWEVKDGIVNHRSACTPHTPEGAIVRLSDKIAYVNHDVQDAIWTGDLTPESLPKHCVEALGQTNSQHINALVVDVIEHSHDGQIQQSEQMARVMADLRAFLFENLYEGPRLTEQTKRAERMIEGLFTYYMKHLGSMPEKYEQAQQDQSRERIVMDYIAGMSDNFAVQQFLGIYVPGELGPYYG